MADFLWESVASAVRAKLLDSFGFDRRALGQWVLTSEVISVIQNVAGVAYVDVDALGVIQKKRNLRAARPGYSRRRNKSRLRAEHRQSQVRRCGTQTWRPVQ